MKKEETKQHGNGSLVNGLLVALILSALIVIGIYFIVKPKHEPVVVQSNTTLMKIYNHTKDTAVGYLTLGATPGCIQNVLDVPFILDTVPGQRGLQGMFLLLPGDSTEAYAPDSLGYNGVISFGYAPDNCTTPSYTNGLNQFEFIINNGYQPGNPQETVDISCVHGVNCVIRVDLLVDSNNVWNAGPSLSNIQSFANTMNRNQVGIAGVYPYGCDTCTGSKTPPSCIPLPQPAQKSSICNVQRDASKSGGLIKVIYLGQVNILK